MATNVKPNTNIKTNANINSKKNSNNASISNTPNSKLNAPTINNTSKKAINIDIDVTENTTDKKYLASINSAIKKGLKNFSPDIVFYNAGTDVLDGDPLNGGVSITEDGVIKRDELVMKAFTDIGIPIVMVLSGGYSPKSVNVISNSMYNLYKKLPN